MTTTTDQSRSSNRGERRRRALWWLTVPAVLAVGGLAVWLLRPHEAPAADGRSEAASETVGDPAVVRVEVVSPTKGGIPRTTVQPGSIHAFESVDLYAMVSGYLKSQSVDIGTTVKKGQVLAEIGVPREARAAEEAAAIVEQARARLRQAAARVRSTTADKLTVAASLAQTKADVDRSAARRVLAESQFVRVKELYDRQAVAQRLVDEGRQDRDAAVAAERVAHLAVEAAEAQITAADAKIEQAEADVAEAKAAVNVAEASLAKAKVDLDYARIVAPFDGTVTHRGFHPGAFIRAASAGGDVPLLTVVRTDLMRVVIKVPDRDVAYANTGDPVELVIDALPGPPFKGTVARVSDSEEPTTRTMRVEVDLPNPDGTLRAGMYCRATIGLETRTTGLKVPVTCVVDRSGKGEGMVRIVRDGRVQQKKVELGADDGSTVEVVSGLAPDDQVVLRASAVLEDGTPVEVAAKG